MEKQLIRFAGRKAMKHPVLLGYEGDNLVERLEFDLPEITAGQTATLMITGADAVKLDRTDEGRYAVDLARDMIGPDGEREAYVRIDGAGEKVWQSAPMRMITGALPDTEEEIERAYPTAVGQMLTAMAEHSGEMQVQEKRVEQAAQRAEDAAERAEAGGGGGGSSAPGTDGGYYRPSVTDGVLSWTPSKTNMPSVPASDVRGPAGQDGQPGKDGAPGKTAYQYAQDGGYKGTEAEFAAKMAQEIPEPYTLPVATADTLGGVMVGDGLNVDEAGRVSVKPEGVYELVEVIEVKSTDEYTAIQRTQTPDGKPYAFEAVYIQVEPINVAGTASISHKYRAGSYTAELNLSIGSGDNGKVACTEAIITAGKLEIKQTHWSAYEWTGNNVQANARQYFVHNAPIERIEMSRSGGFGEVTFAIYGKWKE